MDALRDGFAGMDGPGVQRLERHACFGGFQDVYRHRSGALDCDMTVGVYFPPQAAVAPCPVLYWLSGLTCTEQNFITKAGAQRYAAGHGLVLVAPDTSPRGDGVADEDRYDLGKGAGFYVDATQAPWSRHYRMHDYVARELPAWIESHPAVAGDARAISGHSMGGHGALVMALRNPQLFRSVSAFAPICAPSVVPWGVKAFTAYLGSDRTQWAGYDASALLARSSAPYPGGILIEQGLADKFLETQLRPEAFEAACAQAGQPLTLLRHDGYDHGYYFISTFIEDHLRFHFEQAGQSVPLESQASR